MNPAMPKCSDGMAAMVSWYLLWVQVEPESPFAGCKTSTKPYWFGKRRGGITR
jgi:hypothetical protein